VENERIEIREGRKERFVADRKMHDRLKLGLELRAGNKRVVLTHLLRWRRLDLQGFGELRARCNSAIGIC
jgi:hypothetical protein